MSFMIIRLFRAFSSFSLDEDAHILTGGAAASRVEGYTGRKAIKKFRPKLYLSMSITDGLWIKVKDVENV
ncbi:hypothetical protein C8R44DRAFT_894366 [Mycena epipterygia]|nr:hypothetical protein C8R44DRAFT_894366 [Mycena epipterygia]